MPPLPGRERDYVDIAANEAERQHKSQERDDQLHAAPTRTRLMAVNNGAFHASIQPGQPQLSHPFERESGFAAGWALAAAARRAAPFAAVSSRRVAEARTLE